MTPISSAGACACEYGVALSQWWAKAGSKRVARKQSPWASCCINIKRKNDVQELSGICTGLATSLAKSESPAKTHCCSPYLPLDSRRASQRSHHAGKLQCTRNFGRARACRGDKRGQRVGSLADGWRAAAPTRDTQTAALAPLWVTAPRCCCAMARRPADRRAAATQLSPPAQARL